MKQENMLIAGKLNYEQLHSFYISDKTLNFNGSIEKNAKKAREFLSQLITQGQTIYGINTGFGALANVRINKDQLQTLQERLVLSHASGVGDYFSDDIVKLILMLKVNTLAQGYSGIRCSVISTLQTLYNEQVYPCIPAQGSVGASGDLAPLAHLASVLLGVGNVRKDAVVFSAKEGLDQVGLKPIVFEAKEGLALLNGTQVSTALALKGLFEAYNCFDTALAAGALSLIAINGRTEPFDPRIHKIRLHEGQQKVASFIAQYLEGYTREERTQGNESVQDPYSIRCQPQVMGACLTWIENVKTILVAESNAVTDNPLVFSHDEIVLSGGNFHAEPVAMAADSLALAIAEMGSLSERRIALLMDHHFSGLPSFLINDNGINSGLMNAQVTAAALVSENKCLSYPSCVDSIPTSANQEDHVSMATYGARRLSQMTANLRYILAIELIASCQAIELRGRKNLPTLLESIIQTIREKVPFYENDRYMADDIQSASELIKDRRLKALNVNRF